MKKILIILFCTLTGYFLNAQTPTQPVQGTISFITSQHVYVKFETTRDLIPGDTLYMSQQGQRAAVLKISARSSLSCVCEPLTTMKLVVGDKVYSGQKETIADVPKDATLPIVLQPAQHSDPATKQKALPENKTRHITGRLSIASYTGLSNTPAENSERMQYTLSLNARNIGGSRLSAESYMVFVHRYKEWDKVKEDIFNGLKIYDLSLSYDIGRNSHLLLGRKINPKFSNIGAIDGLQYELKIKSFSAGVIGGFRPDLSNYGFNSSLFQYGGYLYQEHKVKRGSMQNTLAFIEQSNAGNTDRRFAYFQHSNSLIANLYFFGSAELDLYNKVLNVEDSTYNQDHSPKISNLYLSLRYRVMKKLSLSVSYSARKNIVYYESYKSFLDKMLESETLQGYSFHFNYNPVGSLSIGLTASYRFQNQDARDSKNIHGYMTYLVPVMKMNTTASFTWIDASYLGGNIYGLGLSRDLVKGKLDAGINYRYVDYLYSPYDYSTVQHIGELNLCWRILPKLSLITYFEGTFEKSDNRYQRIYIRLSQAF
jgi:hypothetical protein